jgi:hypothetical protein
VAVPPVPGEIKHVIRQQHDDDDDDNNNNNNSFIAVP